MTYLIAVSGLSGAGKTTAISYLASICGGEAIYLGRAILEAVRERSLPETRESERIVRVELRQQHGAAVLVQLNAERIVGHLTRGTPVLIDAIFGLEELELLRSLGSPHALVLVSISASFGTRYHRLRSRADRPFTESELKLRDQTELDRLGTGGVFAAAAHAILNEGSLEAFQNSLDEFWQTVDRGQV